MPFAVSMKQGHPESPKLYAVRDRDGDILWQRDRRKVPPMTEAEADAVAAECDRYGGQAFPAEVVGFTPPAKTDAP